MRTLEAPAEQRPVLQDTQDVRFGCPCSAHAVGGGVRLYHTSSAGRHSRLGAKAQDRHATVARWSSDGLGKWSGPVRVTLDPGTKMYKGGLEMKTFLVAQPSSTRAGAPVFAGYEGVHSVACLAVSYDGMNFSTISPRKHKLHNKACSDGRASLLGRAADAYVTPLVGAHRDLISYRKDFGTTLSGGVAGGGWREIRGLQIVELDARLGSLPNVSHAKIKKVHSAWYFDRLGKLERYRRQLYSVVLAKHAGLYLGLLTVIEWPKDVSAEPVGPDLPAFERDTTNVYLVSSRDGVHLDDGWVYAQRPLIRKGAKQSSWDGGFILPAAQIVSDERSHRVYFEARSGFVHHENRFDGPAVIGVAAWPLDRLVGLRQASRRATGLMTTKLLALRRSGLGGGGSGTADGASLWIDFSKGDGDSANGTVMVAVLDGSGSVRSGFSENECVLWSQQGPHRTADAQANARGDVEADTAHSLHSRRAETDGKGGVAPLLPGMFEVRWAALAGSSMSTSTIGAALQTTGLRRYRAFRLRFTIDGGATLFSFQIR